MHNNKVKREGGERAERVQDRLFEKEDLFGCSCLISSEFLFLFFLIDTAT
jgi:hypothetical protein